MRQKPARWLRYPEGTVARSRASGFSTIHVYCVGPELGPALSAQCRAQAGRASRYDMVRGRSQAAMHPMRQRRLCQPAHRLARSDRLLETVIGNARLDRQKQIDHPKIITAS